MSALAQRQSFYRVVERMPEDTVVTFHDVSWDEYEDLLERVGEASGLRISYNEGTMQVITLSSEHEASRDMFAIYAGLGIPEVWRYDTKQLTIHLLRGSRYVKANASQALPMLTSAILTEFLARRRREGEYQAMLAFDEWLQTHQQ